LFTSAESGSEKGKTNQPKPGKPTTFRGPLTIRPAMWLRTQIGVGTQIGCNVGSNSTITYSVFSAYLTGHPETVNQLVAIEAQA
jgi:hypothetical protein